MPELSEQDLAVQRTLKNYEEIIREYLADKDLCEIFSPDFLEDEYE